ncbi:MAG: hypothetical protein ACC700_20255 [Anaerolineales bacterium]
METVSLVIAWLLAGFLAALMVIIVVLILIGRIKLDKLISEPNGDASLSRFQFLIFTFVIAASFFLIVVGVDPPRFPDRIPSEIFVLLGISAGTYAISKGIQSNYEIRMYEIERQTTGAEGMQAEP